MMIIRLGLLGTGVLLASGALSPAFAGGPHGGRGGHHHARPMGGFHGRMPHVPPRVGHHARGPMMGHPGGHGLQPRYGHRHPAFHHRGGFVPRGVHARAHHPAFPLRQRQVFVGGGGYGYGAYAAGYEAAYAPPVYSGGYGYGLQAGYGEVAPAYLSAGYGYAAGPVYGAAPAYAGPFYNRPDAFCD